MLHNAVYDDEHSIFYIFSNVTRCLEMRVTGIPSRVFHVWCTVFSIILTAMWGVPCGWGINPINFLIRIIRTLISGAYRVNYKNSINICKCHGWLSRASSPVFREAGLSLAYTASLYSKTITIMLKPFPRIAHFLPNKKKKNCLCFCHVWMKRVDVVKK